jgi:hypothetical protein
MSPITGVEKQPLMKSIIALGIKFYQLGLGVDGIVITLPPQIDDHLREEVGGDFPISMPLQVDINKGTALGGSIMIRRGKAGAEVIIEPNNPGPFSYPVR